MMNPLYVVKSTPAIAIAICVVLTAAAVHPPQKMPPAVSVAGVAVTQNCVPAIGVTRLIVMVVVVELELYDAETDAMFIPALTVGVPELFEVSVPHAFAKELPQMRFGFGAVLDVGTLTFT
jgi:hypothetical protein